MAHKYTTPRGTVVRQWPDWRLDHLCIGSYGALAPVGNPFMYISLFNNDIIGRSMVVWNVLTSVDAFNLFFIFLFKGSRGTKAADCTNVSPLRPPAFGQMFIDTPGAPYSDTPVVTCGTLLGEPLPQNTPSLIIPPDYSMALGSDIGGADTSLAVWWLPTPGV